MINSFISRVRFSEVDENCDLTLYALVNYLQDCAAFHGENTGVGPDWTRENRRGWVVTDLRLGVLRYPHFNEEICVKTWSYGFRGVVGYRAFSVESGSGELLAEADSDWVFMDLENYRPIKVTSEQAEAYGCHPDKKPGLDLGSRKVQLPEDSSAEEPFLIREQHLDVNGHVNNGQYVRMALAYVPEEDRIRRMRVEYKRQALLGYRICPHVSRGEGTTTVSLAGEDGTPYFIGEFSV